MKKKNKNNLTPFQTGNEDFWIQGTSAECGRPIVAIRMKSTQTEVYTPSKGWFSAPSYKVVKSDPVLEIKREGDTEWSPVYKDKKYVFIDTSLAS